MNCPHLAKPLQGWERAQSMKLWYDSSWRCSPLRNRHPEPNGSRWATPTSLFQHRPGHPRCIWPGDIAVTLGWLPATELQIAPSKNELWTHFVSDNSQVRLLPQTRIGQQRQPGKP